MENISKHISYFYIYRIGPQYFSLKGFQFFILILSLFLGNKLYMLYILPRMENISILQTHYLFFISGIGPQYFSLQKCSISSSQFSPSIWTSSYLGREISPFFFVHILSLSNHPSNHCLSSLFVMLTAITSFNFMSMVIFARCKVPAHSFVIFRTLHQMSRKPFLSNNMCFIIMAYY